MLEALGMFEKDAAVFQNMAKRIQRMIPQASKVEQGIAHAPTLRSVHAPSPRAAAPMSIADHNAHWEAIARKNDPHLHPDVAAFNDRWKTETRALSSQHNGREYLRRADELNNHPEIAALRDKANIVLQGAGHQPLPGYQNVAALHGPAPTGPSPVRTPTERIPSQEAATMAGRKAINPVAPNEAATMAGRKGPGQGVPPTREQTMPPARAPEPRNPMDELSEIRQSGQPLAPRPSAPGVVSHGTSWQPGQPLMQSQRNTLKRQADAHVAANPGQSRAHYYAQYPGMAEAMNGVAPMAKMSRQKQAQHTAHRDALRRFGLAA